VCNCNLLNKTEHPENSNIAVKRKVYLKKITAVENVADTRIWEISH
jgi:hypothetical protein